MNTKVYGYHLEFLKKFKALSDWLLTHGYTVYHSHRDFVRDAVYSYWCNRSADDMPDSNNPQVNHLMVLFDEKSNSVSVFVKVVFDEMINDCFITGGASVMTSEQKYGSEVPGDFNDNEPEIRAGDEYEL